MEDIEWEESDTNFSIGGIKGIKALTADVRGKKSILMALHNF
jgi:hypothetical protein